MGIYPLLEKPAACYVILVSANTRQSVIGIQVAMTGWKVVFLSAAVAALMLQDTASTVLGPLCDINNGGCAYDQVCVQVHVTISCIRAPWRPCPPPVLCLDICNFIDCSPGTICRVNKETGVGECLDICNLIDCAPGTICRVNEETGAAECVEDICSLKPVTGPCDAYVPSTPLLANVRDLSMEDVEETRTDSYCVNTAMKHVGFM